MQGRRGVDQLGRALYLLAGILIVLNMFLRSRLIRLIIWIVIFWQLFRTFSRNIPAREKENQAFMNMKNRRRTKASAKDPVYRYFVCPGCGLKMRAPAGKGRIKVKCNRCGREFETLV